MDFEKISEERGTWGSGLWVRDQRKEIKVLSELLDKRRQS